ncbi:MAG TPA: polyphenol oxidase family protein [Spirochaetales bacterium]|nr:polyphenol oxidase family protein [Spirochaetales bacterium]
MNALGTTGACSEALHLPLRGANAPVAVMSLAAAGDMGFGDDGNRSRRRAWLAARGFDPGAAASVDLVHSRTVLEALEPSGQVGREADGLVTSGAGPVRVLVMTVADCMPIFVYDRDSGAFGLLHSGWKGTGILAEAVRLMGRLYGSRPGSLSVAFGPCIGSCCYVVDEARARAFESEFGSTAVDRPDGRPRLNLVEANRALADALGLVDPSIAGDCTCCDGRFGSFRRQGPSSFTRMAVAIGHTESV